MPTAIVLLVTAAPSDHMSTPSPARYESTPRKPLYSHVDLNLKHLQIANEVSSLSKSKINMRMTPDDVAKDLTGYGHNAVTPLCSKTKLPIIMSDRINKLRGPFFMGAGEVDLKVGMPAIEFLEAYKDGPVFVVDCTHNT